jgi:hypothetical protein
MTALSPPLLFEMMPLRLAWLGVMASRSLLLAPGRQPILDVTIGVLGPGGGAQVVEGEETKHRSGC